MQLTATSIPGLYKSDAAITAGYQPEPVSSDDYDELNRIRSMVIGACDALEALTDRRKADGVEAKHLYPLIDALAAISDMVIEVDEADPSAAPGIVEALLPGYMKELG